jgi:SPP1 family predicted phage head-tail adaptor
MRAGQFNSRVLLQRPVTTRNPTNGAVITSWVDVASTWADIRFQTGAEALRAAEPISASKASIRMRFREDIDAGCRVVHNTTIFNILAVNPHGREYLDLPCETGANNG